MVRIKVRLAVRRSTSEIVDSSDGTSEEGSETAAPTLPVVREETDVEVRILNACLDAMGEREATARAAARLGTVFVCFLVGCFPLGG